MTPEEPNILTITRQLGSGGAYLGQRVARRLGYAYADRQILLSIAPERIGFADAERLIESVAAPSGASASSADGALLLEDTEP